MKIFNTVEHVWAWITGWLIPRATTAAEDLESIVGSEAAQSLLALASQGAWQSKIVAVVGSIVSGLVDAAKDGKDFEAAVAAYGLNPLLDEVAFADLKDIYTALLGVFGGKTLTATVKIAVPKAK